jgi:two-component system, OmpR family, sensor histidine kinase VicK
LYSYNNSEKTEVLYGSENVLNKLLQFLSKSKTISSCGDYKTPSLVIEVKDYLEILSKIKKSGIKLRYIVDITKDNVNYCKELIKFADEVRHLDGIKTNFSVSESEYLASSTLSQKLYSPEPFQQIIYSNVSDIVEQQKYVFESFWNKAILAEHRVREIEEGVALGMTEVIQIPSKTVEMFVSLVKSAKEEVLLLLPTTNAFLREEKLGVIRYLREAAKLRGVSVRILTPTNDVITKMIQNMENVKLINFVIQVFEPASDIKVHTVTILVIDKKESLVVEKKDDYKENMVHAIGLATYSTSKPTVISYVTIFESLYNQVKLYEQLKIHGKMQDEFINIASHELRTPTQAVLAFSDLLQKHPEQRDVMIDAIKRNATRLQRLTEDILDVTKIETKTLKLYREDLDLSILLSTIVNDYKNNVETREIADIILLDNEANGKHHIINADIQRITQVVTNLLNNAVKFTEEDKEGGSISISLEDVKTGDCQEVIINVKDFGTGIDKEILPRLFTKFATKSTKGTGLGLFICKSMVEAHNGKIWAENNKDGKGATFSFSLPFSKYRD